MKKLLLLVVVCMVSLSGTVDVSACNRVEITTQNHGFAVSTDSLLRDLEPTHVNLNDNTLEGMRHRPYPLFSVQYHPEASAGPHDSSYLFEEFRKLMG